MPRAPDLSGCALDDRYELRAIIGEGTFGRVYEGFDRRLARSVAVKVIKPWWADDPEWVATFERETRFLARVSDPGIVQIYDVGHAAQGLYYVAELVDGESLAGRLRRGPLPAWEACEVAAQLCRALAGAHAQRIVHRDVKPANIMLSAEGRVKVGDFGVARLAEGSTDGTAASIVGTPRYMAPEQGRGRPTTPATDVYSAGVVLYEMLSGAPPFIATSVVELALLHLQEPPPPLSHRLPASLVQIVERALAKEPARRYADGAEMADALLGAARTGTRGRAPHRVLVGAAAGQRRSEAPRRVLGGGSAPNPPNNAVIRTAAPLPPPPAPGPHGTRRVPEYSPRRTVNPARRRRAVAAVGLVIGLLVAMVAAALVIGHTTYTRVPSVLHRSRERALSTLRRAHLRPTTHRRYASAAAGTVIGELPRGRTRVARGTTVALTISRGPAPVQVLNVVHSSVADAERALHGLGLHTAARDVPAPGSAPGTVVGQTPAGGQRPRGSTVTLRVAEVPRWHTVTTFTGRDSGAFRIIGRHWRLVYTMGFHGTCTWILFCSGPTARVVNAGSGGYVAGFGLQNGTGQIQGFDSGAGSYAVRVTPGSDEAGWSVQVQDEY
ncbi:MAG TPA: protein kinase [Solirubrobacteraceae bacterium]|jgi:serine/threonine-protein kinase|nr:protein kinase [Solirubrobacteraceae bacterium]